MSPRFWNSFALTVRSTNQSLNSGFESRKPILIASNPWSGSSINAHIAKILLQEVAGIPASIVEIDEFSQWEFMAQGQIHACLEVW